MIPGGSRSSVASRCPTYAFQCCFTSWLLTGYTPWNRRDLGALRAYPLFYKPLEVVLKKVGFCCPTSHSRTFAWECVERNFWSFRSMQDMLWAAMFEPANWGDDEHPKPVEQAPEITAKLGTSFGLLHNEVGPNNPGPVFFLWFLEPRSQSHNAFVVFEISW